MKGRNFQVARIICLISLLDKSAGGLTVSEIGVGLKNRGFKVTNRTVYRDLGALDQAGLPVFMADSDDLTGSTRWRFDHKIKVLSQFSNNF